MRFILLILAMMVATSPALAQTNVVAPAFQETVAASKSNMMRDPAAALDLARKAATLAPSEHSLETATAMWLQGEALIRLNKPNEAQTTIDKALAIVEAVDKNTKLYGDLLFAKAGIAKAVGNYAAALTTLQTAHEAFLKLGESRARSMVLQDIASVYTDARDYKRALHYYEQAGEAYAGDPAIDLTRYNNIGFAYREMKEYPKAEEGFRKALKMAQEMASPLLQERILSNVASVQLMAGRIKEAEQTIDQGFALAPNGKELGWEPFLWGVSAEIELKKDNPHRAAQFIARTFRGEDLGKTVMLFREFHSAAHAIYSATGDTTKALQHLAAFKRLDDEARDISAAANTALMSAQFDFATQELQIANLRTESLQREVDLQKSRMRQRAMLAGAGAVIVLILLSGLAAHYLSMRRSRNQVHDANTRLSASNTALEKALKAKSEFLATTSHEIRTPLNGILGMTQMLLYQKTLAPEVRERVELMHASGETMKAIVDDILDVAKMETGVITVEHSDFDLRKALSEVARIWRDAANEKGVEVVIDLDDCPAVIHSDAQRIRQIAFNLMSNAVKFTEVGRVTLSAVADRTLDTPVLRICVADTGCGIPQDQLEAIFEPFHQVDGAKTRRHSGTGLGLSICKSIVGALGGDITVTSTEREGSRLTVSLPLQEANSAVTPSESGAASHYRILIADSNPLHQSLLEGFLEADGVIVETCDTMEDALDSTRRQRPDALFLDCGLLGSHPQAATQAAMSLADAADGARLVARLGATLIQTPMLRLAGFDDVIEGEFDAAAIASHLHPDESKLTAAG